MFRGSADALKTPEYTPIQRKISDIKGHFKNTMSAEEYKTFEQLENLYTESATIEDVDLFGYRLSMGILLMIEVFGFRDSKFTEQDNE